MSRAEYRAILQPAIEAAIDHFILFESKYGEGVFLQDDDLIKCAGHAISAYRGLENDDGASHEVATLTRALKGVLAGLDK